MAAHAILDIQGTIPAYPLGKPVDGRPRYGMTPEQARIYRWLVANRPHDKSFRVDFRRASATLNVAISSMHHAVSELVVRGWLDEVSNGSWTRYKFVQPIRHFAEPPTRG